MHQDSPAHPARRHARTSPREVFRRLWPLARLHRGRMSLAVAALLVAAACDAAAVQIFARLTDGVLATGRLSGFPAPAALWAGTAVLGAAATYTGTYTMGWVGERFLLRLRDRTYDHAQRLSPDFYQGRPEGDLLTRFTSDIDSVQPLLTEAPVQLVNTGANIVFFAGCALWIRWELALAAFAAAPLYWLAARFLAARIRTVARDERDRNGALTDALAENLATMPLVQLHNRQEAERQRVHREGEKWMRSTLAGYRLSAAYGPLAEVIETACVLGVVGAGAWEISDGRLTIGGLLAFAAYLGYLYPHILGLGSLAVEVSSATAAAERVLEVLDARPAVADAPAARPLPAGARPGAVTLDRVSFGYPGTGRPVVAGLSFSARPGELVLVGGASGTGKSTLAGLLLRLYDPTGGRILLDGVDLRDLALADLRDLVTLVPQDSMLINATVRENITHGRPGATDEEVRRAAAAADLQDVVAALPDGYDTRIGPRGQLLSGGQRRRLAIARALLRDSPVLVLDEPTTGLDAAAAERVMVPLRRLMAHRTTFLISHDPLLAAMADTVLALDGELQSEFKRPLMAHPHSAASVVLASTQNTPEGKDI
ncbi:ABC transporter ATP-binding protein [Peterkaempfera sp. SMS 1(5)a]|uniref:ABC transporter ATP-binding protein n=1 Tax=Peterkaempfera podocarpi TaxID=3232308 RepID=UPI00366BED08